MKTMGYNLWVILGLLLLSIALGVVNNLRVYEEQRVSWWGYESEE